MENDMLRKTDIREEMLTLISEKYRCSLEWNHDFSDCVR